MTDRYAVIGNPVEHSLSPRIHAAFAAQTGQAMGYGRILGEAGGFAGQVQRFFTEGGRGLNVTVPFKEAAWRLADEHGPRAIAAEAVNTLILLPDGHIRGDNTDGVGLVRDLASHQGIVLAGLRVLLLGAGGGARGVLGPLLEAGPAALVIANRTPAKAIALATRVAGQGPVTGCSLESLPGRAFDLIVNATAAGLADQMPAIPDDCLAQGGVTYDLMYADRPTAFVEWGRAHGAALALDGLGMLVEQAAESFFLWRGVRPDTGPLRALLRPPA